MKNKKWLFLSLMVLFFTFNAQGKFYANPHKENSSQKLSIVCAYPFIESITREITGDKAEIFSFAKGTQDPHFITPKPSFIAKMRKADLLIINGAELEIGWILPLINQSNNPNIQSGKEGYLDLSQFVKLIEIPTDISRAHGDVHPQGNPHFHLNPDNILIITSIITKRLCSLDSTNCEFYSKNLKTFKENWLKKTKEWETSLSKLKGAKVITYHKVFTYFLKRYEIIEIANIEPLPGIPTTSRHIEKLKELGKKENIKIILQDAYHSYDASENIAHSIGAKVILLPHDIGTVKEVSDIFSLFDQIVKRLNQ